MSLPEYKAQKKAELRQVFDQQIFDSLSDINRVRVLYQDNATLKTEGEGIIDALDASYDGYAADIDAATDEAGVDAVMGSVSF